VLSIFFAIKNLTQSHKEKSKSRAKGRSAEADTKVEKDNYFFLSSCVRRGGCLLCDLVLSILFYRFAGP
jgi:hypothetical protein